MADRCLLLYNGLTQGQGHTVTSPSVRILSQIWLSLFTINIKGFAFLNTVYREKLMKNTMTGLPRVREKSGKNKIFSRSGNCQGILKKCQGILAI